MNNKSDVVYNKSFSSVIAKVLTVFFMALMIIYALSLLVPIFWLITNSFKGYIEYYQESSFTFPKKLVFTNYVHVFDLLKYPISTPKGRITLDIWWMTYYSFAYSLGTAIYSVVTLLITSYAIGRYKFWLTKLLYAIGIFVMIFPVVTDGGVGLLLKKSLGIYDNMALTILTSGGCIFTGQYFWIMCSFFEHTGKDYYEAALVDGAGQWKIFIQIMVPLAFPLMTVVFVLSFISSWNSYGVFMFYLPSYANLALGMMNFQSSASIMRATTPEVLAGFVIIAVPLVIMYAFSQKLIVKNLNIGGVKG